VYSWSSYNCDEFFAEEHGVGVFGEALAVSAAAGCSADTCTPWRAALCFPNLLSFL